MHTKRFPSDVAQKFLVRFEHQGHRDRIKAQAAQAKRSLNKQLLVLIEAGEKAIQQSQGAQA